MSEVCVREYTPSDVPALTALWHEVFGDSPEFLSQFFALLPKLGTAAVAVADGRTVGAAYAVTGLELVVPGVQVVTCGYIYAVAVDAAFRRRGIGEAVTKKARELAIARGAGIICTLPAGESLYPWYEKSLGTLYRLHRSISVLPCTDAVLLRPLSAKEYMRRRETLLESKPHLRPCTAAAELEARLCAVYGGGLFSVGNGIAAVYRDGDTAVIHELIAPDGASPEQLASSIGAASGCLTVRTFTLTDSGSSYIASDLPLPADCCFTFSFE